MGELRRSWRKVSNGRQSIFSILCRTIDTATVRPRTSPICRCVPHDRSRCRWRRNPHGLAGDQPQCSWLTGFLNRRREMVIGSLRPRRIVGFDCKSLSAAAARSRRSRRSSSMRARIVAKSSAARGRGTFPPPSAWPSFDGRCIACEAPVEAIVLRSNSGGKPRPRLAQTATRIGRIFDAFERLPGHRALSKFVQVMVVSPVSTTFWTVTGSLTSG
jgi:hypothetical protein